MSYCISEWVVEIFAFFFCLFACFAILVNVFSRGRETVQLAVLVGRSVCHNPELQAVFALLPLPNHLRLSCRVSGLVYT